MQGNESKLELIQFFILNNDHLSNLVESALKPYELTVEPAPLLTLSLNLDSLLGWYADILHSEMINYVDSSLAVSSKSFKINSRQIVSYLLLSRRAGPS